MKLRFQQGHKGMTRREFGRLVAAAAVAAALPKPAEGAQLTLPAPGPEAIVSLVGVARDSQQAVLPEAVRMAAESITDFSWLSKGDSVLIKPALNSGNSYPATTKPSAIEAMVSLLKDKGAGRVILSDMSGIEYVKLSPNRLKGSSRQLMQKCGMAQAAEAAGAELYFPEEDGWEAFFEDGPASGSHWKAGIMMPQILKEVDHLILMPRCSRHILLGSTLGMKAAVGYWRTDSRLEYHHDAATIQEKTAEANTVSSLQEKQRLVLTTATRTLATFGPDKGRKTKPETGLVFASDSIVAHDMVSLAWLLENRKLVSASDKKGSHDPYTSQMIVGFANRLVVKWLGGIGQAFSSERLVRNDIDTIWDDRVLNRAFHLWNGIPQVKLVNVDDTVPDTIRQNLASAVLLPEA